MAKIDYGEVDYPDSSDSQAAIRNLFLKAIQNHAQYVLTDLHENLSLYLCLSSREQELLWLDTCEDRSEEVKALVKAVVGWADTYNLRADWCIRGAIQTLKEWSKSSKASNPLIFDTVSPDWWTRPNRPTFSAPYNGGMPYNPFHDRVDYLNYIRTQATESIKSNPLLRFGDISTRKEFVDSIVKKHEKYCIEIENCAIEQGFPQKRNAKKNLLRDLQWTVQVRITCKNNEEANAMIAKIAKQKKQSHNTVRDAVKYILKSIGLPLYPTFLPKKGRPAKRKDSKDSKRQRDWF